MTRELRSSIVIGASSSDAIAFATAKRSPDGSPPIDSCSATPISPSATSERSIAARCAHGAPRLTLSRAHSATHRRRSRTPGVTATGARTTSPAAPPPAELTQQLDDGVLAADADTEDQGVRGHGRHVDSVVDDQPGDLHRPVRVAVDEVEQGGAEVVDDPAEAGPGRLSSTVSFICSTLRQ